MKIGEARKGLSAKVLQRFFERAAAGLAIVDRRGHCLKTNPAFRQMFGLGGDLTSNLSLQAGLQTSPQVLRHLLEAPTFSRSSRAAALHTADGRNVRLDVMFQRFTRQLAYCLATESTTHAQKPADQSEQDRKFREIGERTAQIVHAMKGGNLALKYVLQMVNRNPESFLVYLTSLNQIAARLSAVIEHSLKTPAAPELFFREVDLLELVNEAVKLPEIVSRIGLCGISFVVKGRAVRIEADQRELQKALIFLLENAIDAIKAKGDGGKITITIASASKYLPDGVGISVADNGIGIPPKYNGRIFEPFFTTKKGGSGIGLAAVRTIVETYHQGTISFNSQAGISTKFTLHLPRRLVTQRVQIAGTVNDKLRLVRQELATRLQNHRDEIEACISSMTGDHVLESTVTELTVQVQGQLSRLEKYLQDGQPLISVNNNSRRTEVVLTCDKDSSARQYWEQLIHYELQTMHVGDLITVTGTRKTEKSYAVCRIFEVKTLCGKLQDSELQRLEKVLLDKFTPLPTLAELDQQAQLMEKALKLLAKSARKGSVHSLIFNPAIDEKMRLANYRLLAVPPFEPPIEEAVALRFILERSTPPDFIGTLMDAQRAQGDIFLVNEALTPAVVEKYQVGQYGASILSILKVKSAIGVLFETEQGGEVANFLCSSASKAFSPDEVSEFLALNNAWRETTAIPHK